MTPVLFRLNHQMRQCARHSPFLNRAHETTQRHVRECGECHDAMMVLDGSLVFAKKFSPLLIASPFPFARA